ncbi:MAG: helix-turn-helix transcriptional regulator [Eubacteriales bacterium]|nr:helix-turn-helix transcriptional regulator [Clostridiales bacterium]MDY5836448.1 helix-turn-helix transcriptional regulator [Eubacteriales bacterium]
MSNASVDASTVKEKLMQDKAFANEYDRLKPRYMMISQIISERKKNNLTQEELAIRVGTKKSNISRLESGNYNPSLDFLSKVAEALGKELEVSLS